MPPRPKRAATKKIDYSQFVDENGGEDDKDVDVVMEDVEQHESAEDEPEDDEFLEVPDEAEADDDGDVEILAEDIEEEKKPKKRGRKPKDEKAVKIAPQKKKPGPKKEAKNARSLSSVKDKLLRMFGYNNEKLIKMVELRRDWEFSMFQFDEDKLEESPDVPMVTSPIVKFNTISKVQLSRKFPVDKRNVTFQLAGENAQVIADAEQIRSETLHVLNTNMLITDMAWKPLSKDSSEQLLIVSVSNITDTSTSPKFSLLARNSYVSGFQIYKLDVATGELKLFKTIIHNWGNSWNLRWLKSSSELGAVCAVFNDGNARILNLPSDGPDVIEITVPSLEYQLPEDMITCFDVAKDRVLCGTDTGHIVEFTLTDVTPSYMYPLHTCYIFSLSLSTSPFDEPTIFTSCSDGTTALASLTDLSTSAIRTAKSKDISKTTSYSPQLHSFLLMEGSSSVKALPIRADFVTSTLASHDGSIESIAASRIHPMLLSGGADGRVKINSIARRLLNGQKVALIAHKVLTLWELQYGQLEDTFRLVRNYTVEAAGQYETSEFRNVYPRAVSFGAMAWNENKCAGKWFAAGTTGGLLFVDKL